MKEKALHNTVLLVLGWLVFHPWPEPAWVPWLTCTGAEGPGVRVLATEPHFAPGARLFPPDTTAVSRSRQTHLQLKQAWCPERQWTFWPGGV